MVWIILPLRKLNKRIFRSRDHVVISLPFFLKAILNSADSAPGIDNVPYAYYRTNPSQHARKLQEKLKNIIEGKQPPPKQLLVWIPKAEAGYKADNWRPLSMPVTWDRLIDQAAYAAILPFFEAKLDHAQNLICGPQKYFLWIQVITFRMSK